MVRTFTTVKWLILVLLMAEILHQLIGSLSHYLQGFSTIPGGAGFQPSTVGLRFWMICKNDSFHFSTYDLQHLASPLKNSRKREHFFHKNTPCASSNSWCFTRFWRLDSKHQDRKNPGIFGGFPFLILVNFEPPERTKITTLTLSPVFVFFR